MWCSRSRSTNRLVDASRISASSSQLSHSRRTASMYSAASPKRSPTGGTDRGPTYSPSDSRSDTITDQPARPPLTWSSVASCVETRNGSVVTVGISGTSPTATVTGATRQAISVGSSHGTRAASGPAGDRFGGPSASVTNSSPPRSASAISARPVTP